MLATTLSPFRLTAPIAVQLAPSFAKLTLLSVSAEVSDVLICIGIPVLESATSV